MPGVTLTLTGSISGSTLSDGSGNYAFGVINGGSYAVTPTKTGLAPGSNGINTVDVLAAQRHFLQIVLLTGCPLAAADVNGDSNVTTLMSLPFSDFSSAYRPGSPMLEDTSSILRAARIRS